MTRIRSTWIFRACLTLILVAALTALSLRGQSATQPTADATQASTAHVSPPAQALLDKIRDAYAKLTSLDVAGRLSVVFDGGGQQQNDHSDFTGAFRAPDKFRHELKDDTTIVTSGDKVYTYVVKKNAYLTDDAPKDRSDALPGEVGALLMDQDPSLAMAMGRSASDTLIAGASDVSLLDETKVDGVSYPTLKVVQPDEDQTVLIDPKTYLVRSVQHDLRRSMEHQGVPNVKLALVTVDYTPAPGNAQPQAVSFDWTPPADAKPLADPTPAPGGGENPWASVAAQLEGKAAPDFTLKQLDGKTVSLSDLKGSVVVLDFWATWCPPCRAGLPHIDKVAKERSADGVKIFAVNLQEDATQIQPFMQQNNLTLPVLLDSDGAVAGKYLAESIPETVVIDKKGIVHKVIGLPLFPDEEKALNDEIDAALKDK
jgi:peroxiredoxin/outer membrane lipoprotein-sorting protein